MGEPGAAKQYPADYLHNILTHIREKKYFFKEKLKDQ